MRQQNTFGRRKSRGTLHHAFLSISYIVMINNPPFPLHAHLLKMPDDSHVGIHVAVDAVLHASVLVAREGALGHAAGDALLEADGVELVDGWKECKYT